MERVAAFTDTYLPTINGVTYTITTWRDRWQARGGDMVVVYPASTDHEPATHESSVRSIPFPFYDGYRLGLPQIPKPVRQTDFDLVHVHTPFAVGYAGLRLAKRQDIPIVASYHTPTAEYTDYLAPHPWIAKRLRRLSRGWERWFLNKTDHVLVPSDATQASLETLGVTPPVDVLPNGVDINRFRPIHPGAFQSRHGIETDRPIVGYTGRHGYEKHLDELITAAADLEVTLVLAGDGPARADLEQQAADNHVDARFLGFLDREDLPAFYAALDVFAFPSPVETQGIVALEAMACGTPVVAANQAALLETVEDGVNGFHYESGDIAALRAAIEQAIEDNPRLREACLEQRDAMSVERTIDHLADLYRSLR